MICVFPCINKIEKCKHFENQFFGRLDAKFTRTFAMGSNQSQPQLQPQAPLHFINTPIMAQEPTCDLIFRAPLAKIASQPKVSKSTSNYTSSISPHPTWSQFERKVNQETAAGNYVFDIKVPGFFLDYILLMAERRFGKHYIFTKTPCIDHENWFWIQVVNNCIYN